jgi:hypothetical protein
VTEWGCMQALIDFEGYRKWKEVANNVANSNASLDPAKRAADEQEEKAKQKAAIKALFARPPPNTKKDNNKPAEEKSKKVTTVTTDGAETATGVDESIVAKRAEEKEKEKEKALLANVSPSGTNTGQPNVSTAKKTNTNSGTPALTVPSSSTTTTTNSAMTAPSYAPTRPKTSPQAQNPAKSIVTDPSYSRPVATGAATNDGNTTTTANMANTTTTTTTTSSRAHASYLAQFLSWLRLKNYQYEVTFSLYMLTPTERVVFNVILLTLISMLITAASLYLPDHVAVIYRRISYYVSGTGGEGVKGVAEGMVRSFESVKREVEATTRTRTEL